MASSGYMFCLSISVGDVWVYVPLDLMSHRVHILYRTSLLSSLILNVHHTSDFARVLRMITKHVVYAYGVCFTRNSEISFLFSVFKHIFYNGTQTLINT